MSDLKNLLKIPKKTFNFIKKRKLLFFGLILLQLLIISSLSYVFISYQIEIFESLEKLNAPLANLDLENNPEASAEDFLSQSLTMYSVYNSMLKDIFWMCFWLLLIFLIFNPLLWLGSHYLSSKGWKKSSPWKKRLLSLSKIYLKYVSISTILFVPFFLFCYLFVTNFITLDNLFFSLIAKVFGIIFIILSYVLLFSFTLINISSWKKFFKSIIFVNFRKVHYSILVLAITLALFSLSVYLIYYTTMILGNFYLMMLALFLLLTILTFNRFLLIVYSSEIVKSMNDNLNNKFKLKLLSNNFFNNISKIFKLLKNKIK